MPENYVLKEGGKMIFVTGDCHGNFERFKPKYFPEQAQMTNRDIVICAGDFHIATSVIKSPSPLEKSTHRLFSPSLQQKNGKYLAFLPCFCKKNCRCTFIDKGFVHFTAKLWLFDICNFYFIFIKICYYMIRIRIAAESLSPPRSSRCLTDSYQRK